MPAGLRADEEAVEAGVAWVGRRVRDSRTRITLEALVEGFGELELSPSAAVIRQSVSLATLAPDPLAPECDLALDRVDRVTGESAFLKRRPAPSATWAQLQSDIEAVPARSPAGTAAVALRGRMHQATGSWWARCCATSPGTAR